jgi:hypothetical protein
LEEEEISMYFLKVKTISVTNEAGDSVVELRSHLADSAGVAFTTQTGNGRTLDTFTIRAPASSLPGSGYLAYLTALAQDELAKHYNVALEGTAEHGGDTLLMSEDDISGNLFIGLQADGPGLAAPETLDSIISPTEILLSGTFNMDFTGNSTSPEISRTGNVTLDSPTISGMSSTTGLEGGMIVDGFGIPSGAVILAVNSGTEIVISQNALATTGGASLTFTTNAESAYLDSLSPAIFDDRYMDLGITGPNLPADTIISEVVSSSRVRLSQNATGSNTGATYSIGDNIISYDFDTSTLTVDYSDLQRVVDIINFSVL